MFRWLATNFQTFLLAFALALAVWVTAVISSNPDVTQAYPNPIPIEYIGQDPSLIMTGTNIPHQVEITLRAPQSIFQSLLAGETSIKALVDLTGLQAGTHSVSVQIQIDARPLRIISVTPATFDLTLETQETISYKIFLTLSGSPAIGYQVGDATLDPQEVIISGAQSLVSQIDHVQARLDLTDARQAISKSITIQALTADGSVVKGVSLNPANVQVNLPIVQQGGYRDLAVKVMTIGNPANGYSLTGVAAFPPIVTVYSANSVIIDSMPGYVETASLDLTGADQDIEKQLDILIPSGVTLIGDQSVLVKVGIAPIESSRKIDFREVEMIGQIPGLDYNLSPLTVDVILSGPLPELDSMAIGEIHVQVDVTNLTSGTYQLTPIVQSLPQEISVESLLPGTVQVIISSKVTPTP